MTIIPQTWVILNEQHTSWKTTASATALPTHTAVQHSVIQRTRSRHHLQIFMPCDSFRYLGVMLWRHTHTAGVALQTAVLVSMHAFALLIHMTC